MNTKEMKGKQLPEPHVRPFGEWLLEQRAGGLHIELGEQLAGLVEAVDTHGKKGTLTLTISVAPVKGGGAVVVSDKVAVKAPEGDKADSFYFVDGEGNLRRNNPNQPELGELREVPKPDLAEVREAVAAK